jgi:hypothetical protein
MITTLSEFILRVNRLQDISDACDVFEEGCTQALRDQIYTLADDDSCEPFRSAMINMGFTSY